jgi:hypothetical protein
MAYLWLYVFCLLFTRTLPTLKHWFINYYFALFLYLFLINPLLSYVPKMALTLHQLAISFYSFFPPYPLMSSSPLCLPPLPPSPSPSPSLSPSSLYARLIVSPKLITAGFRGQVRCQGIALPYKG